MPGLPLVRLIDDPEKERELGRSLRLHRPAIRSPSKESSRPTVVARADGRKRSRRSRTNRTAQIAQSEPMSRRFTDYVRGS
jgi:hypothetical protein